jgi:hypothetical protein
MVQQQAIARSAGTGKRTIKPAHIKTDCQATDISTEMPQEPLDGSPRIAMNDWLAIRHGRWQRRFH